MTMIRGVIEMRDYYVTPSKQDVVMMSHDRIRDVIVMHD